MMSNKLHRDRMKAVFVGFEPLQRLVKQYTNGEANQPRLAYLNNI